MGTCLKLVGMISPRDPQSLQLLYVPCPVSSFLFTQAPTCFSFVCSIRFLYGWGASNQGVSKVWEKGRRESVSHCISKGQGPFTTRGDLPLITFPMWHSPTEIAGTSLTLCFTLLPMHQASMGMWDALEIDGSKRSSNYTHFLAQRYLGLALPCSIFHTRSTLLMFSLPPTPTWGLVGREDATSVLSLF